MNFPKYPSIDNLYKATDVLQYKCVVTEKIHGTNVRFMWSPTNGGLVLGSRENVIYKDGQRSGELYGFTEFMSNHPILEKFHNSAEFDDFVFYGEFFGSSIQKGVKYCEGKDLRIFDVLNPDGRFLDWYEVIELCEKVGLKHVPEIAIGMLDVAFLESIRDSVSVVAGESGIIDENNTWEGVVVKPVRMTLDKRGNWLMAKYKSDKWAENAKAPKTKTVDADKVELQNRAREFADTVVTPGRVATVADHITRTGDTSISMTRTGEFLREFVKDVNEEYKDFFAALDKNAAQTHNKAISGLASVAWKKYVEDHYRPTP
jgi:Rnl2 family RNA ligase